jgi:hypothetical protein
VLKSRFNELYPMHPCPKPGCGLEHVKIPHIFMPQKSADGETHDVPLVPFELIGVADGSIRPGSGRAMQIDEAGRMLRADTPAYIYGLLWGPPGAQRPAYQRILYMN